MSDARTIINEINALIEEAELRERTDELRQNTWQAVTYAWKIQLCHSNH